jgi:hypothetical protein
MNNSGATLGSAPPRETVTEVANHLRNQKMPIQASITQNHKADATLPTKISFSRMTLTGQGRPLAKSPT